MDAVINALQAPKDINASKVIKKEEKEIFRPAVNNSSSDWRG